MSGEWTPEEVATLHRLRCVNGWSCSAIGQAMGRSKHSIMHKVRRMDMQLPAHIRRGKSFVGFGDYDRQLREAFENGTQIKAVAKAIGISDQTVRHAFNIYRDELLLSPRPQMPVGTYIGAKEMARIVSPAIGVPVRAIFGPSRYRAAVLARMAITKALRDRGHSLPVITRALNKTCHTTAINLLANYPAYSRMYPELPYAYDMIKQAEARASERLAA